MRTEIAIAAGLFITNLALLDDDPPSPPPPAFEPVELALPAARTVTDAPPPAACPPPADEFASLRHETLALAKAWRARHRCEPLPAACTNPDPVSILYADVDPSGTFEKVIGNRRFGVAMFTANDELLGTLEPVGCGGWPADLAGDQSLSLSTLHVASTVHSQVIVRTRTVGHCGEMLHATVVERRGDELAALADLDMAGERGCNVWQSQVRAHIAANYSGEIKVHYHGRERQGIGDSLAYGPWTAVDQHCTLRAGDDGRFHPIDDASRELCYQPE